MKYNNNDIAVVWVDLDDTIIDFTTNAHCALVRMWHDEQCLQRLFPDPESWAECYERYNIALWADYNVGRISRDYLRMERFRRPLMQGGMTAIEARLTSTRFDPLYLDYLAREKRLMPEALDLLKYLRRHNATVGILSNGFKEVQFRKIKSAGLEPYIDIVVLSDDIGINKPDVRLYRYAMQRSGDTDPSHHIMIGDNPDTDIRGAIDAGWNAIWYNAPRNHDTRTCPERAAEIRRLKDVTETLR